MRDVNEALELVRRAVLERGADYIDTYGGVYYDYDEDVPVCVLGLGLTRAGLAVPDEDVAYAIVSDRPGSLLPDAIVAGIWEEVPWASYPTIRETNWSTDALRVLLAAQWANDENYRWGLVEQIAQRVAERSTEYMGNIGENPKEWEFEPIEEPSSVPEPVQVPVPAEPVKVPEEVPA